jgi:hypothetical protein
VTWRPESHILVVSQLPEDFDYVPAKPQAGINRFAAPLPDLLQNRLDPAAIAWLALSVEDKTTFGLAVTVLPLLPADREALMKLKALAASLRIDGPNLELTAQSRQRRDRGRAGGCANESWSANDGN